VANSPWESVSDSKVQTIVDDILHRVKTEGDQAVLELTAKLDRRQLAGFSELIINAEQLTAALNSIPEDQRHALEQAAQRIRDYHDYQRQD